MQRRSTLALSLVLLASGALSACTSGTEPEENTTTAGPTGDAATTQNPNWFCRLIDKATVDAATGGRSAEAYEVEVMNEEDEFQCDVVVPAEGEGTETAMSMSMHRNIPNLADELLAEVKAIDNAAPGPEHLGVSYVADGLAVSVVPCSTELMGGEDLPQVPYVFVLRAQLDEEGAATDLLANNLTRLVRETDQNYGCSPSKIHENDESVQTEAPADDAAVTTAP